MMRQFALSGNPDHLCLCGSFDRRRSPSRIRSGAVDYISVPVVPEVLRAKVSIFTELHRRRRQLQELNRDLEAGSRSRSEALRVLNSQLPERVAELESIMRVLPVGVAVAHNPECDFVTGNAALSQISGNEPWRQSFKEQRHPISIYREGRVVRDEERRCRKL